PRRADVRRAGAADSHAHRERDRRAHHPARPLEPRRPHGRSPGWPKGGGRVKTLEDQSMYATPPTISSLDVHQLERSPRRPRTLKNWCLSVLCGILALVAAVPLLSVLLMLIVRGGARLSLALFTQLPPAAGMTGGGIGNAIVGTLLVIFIA